MVELIFADSSGFQTVGVEFQLACVSLGICVATFNNLRDGKYLVLSKIEVEVWAIPESFLNCIHFLQQPGFIVH